MSLEAEQTGKGKLDGDDCENQTATEHTANVLATLSLVLFVGCLINYHRAVMLPWIYQKLHQIDFSGLCLVGSFMVAVWFNLKNRCVQLYLAQQRRLTYVDRIPSIQRDLAGVKADVRKITDILSRPGWKRLL